MAWIMQREHKFKAAIELGARVVDILESAYGSKHPEVATAYTNYGLLLDCQDQMTRSITFLWAAHSISEKLYGDDSKIAYQIKKYMLGVFKKKKLLYEVRSLESQIARHEREEGISQTANLQETEESKKVIKVYIGNDLTTKMARADGTPMEIQIQLKKWNVFVRSTDPEFYKCISAVEFRFHPDWMTRGNHHGRLASNIIKLDCPPFVFATIGWPPMNGLPKEHREALLKIVIVLYLHEKFKCEPVSLPYELTLPIKTEMASTETTGNGREIEYEFIQENGKAFVLQFLGKSAADSGGWMERV